mmetsp:Transcript_30353/g.64423  ORF Transcript_30353/g.64423 Transcript_30353/m.64423 type:complete len:84 (-) Transcript_30353:28-279(-)
MLTPPHNRSCVTYRDFRISKPENYKALKAVVIFSDKMRKINHQLHKNTVIITHKSTISTEKFVRNFTNFRKTAQNSKSCPKCL